MIILGAATGYSPAQLAPFVNSLQLLQLEGAAHLLIYAGDHESAKYLDRCNISFTEITREPRWLPEAMNMRLKNRGRMRFLHYAISRIGSLETIPAKVRRSRQ